MTRKFLPFLHLLLGLGNKVMDQLWELIQDWIEKLDDEVAHAQNVNVVSFLTLEKVVPGCNIACSELW